MNGTNADLVLTGGTVLTMDSPRPRAGAVAVAGGRIVGGRHGREIERLCGPRTRRIDLRGRTLLPGFQDAHVHPSMAAIDLTRCPLHDLPPTLDAYLETIRAYAADNPDREWIGRRLVHEAFPGGTPTRQDLDRVVPDRPAFFVNRDGHGAWVNSRALDLAGINRDTRPAARPHRARHRGDPSGTLHESAVDLVRILIPAPTVEDLVGGLELAQAYLHRLRDHRLAGRLGDRA